MRRNRLQAFDALMVQGQRVPMRLPIWPTAGQPSAAEARSSETGHRRRCKTGSPDVLSARVSLKLDGAPSVRVSLELDQSMRSESEQLQVGSEL
jgi:hypothetical protein